MIEQLVHNYENHVDLINKYCKKYIVIQKVFLILEIIFLYISLKIKPDDDFQFGLVICLIVLYFLIHKFLNHKLFKRLYNLMSEKCNWKTKKEISQLKGKKYRIRVLAEYDRLQKRWINNYCHKKQINSFQKTMLVRDEIEKLYNSQKNKYVKPAIVFSLLLVLWEKGVELIFNHFDTNESIALIVFIVLMFYMLGNILEKDIRDTKKIFFGIDKYRGKNRLCDLIVYNAISQRK